MRKKLSLTTLSAQTERRGDAGPVRLLLARRDAPATIQNPNSKSEIPNQKFEISVFLCLRVPSTINA
jgi:hypothetical protein